MKIPWKRYFQTELGQKFLSFLLPFRARPSEFAERTVHPLYGRVGGIPFVALVPAWFFGKSLEINATTASKMFANETWKGRSYEEAITGTLHQIFSAYWTAFIFSFFIINVIAMVRFVWHFTIRKFVEKRRKDGKLTGPAPIQFFMFHTSGIASWFGAMMLAFSIVNIFFPGRQFSVIDDFFNRNIMWQLAAGMMMIFALVKYYQSNTEIFMKIYRNEEWVGKVRKISLVLPIGFFFLVFVAGMFSLMQLLKISQQMRTMGNP